MSIWVSSSASGCLHLSTSAYGCQSLDSSWLLKRKELQEKHTKHTCPVLVVS